MTSLQDDLDLDAYLERIGYGGPLTPSIDTLHALHFAHATCIPFENIDVLMKLPIRLDLASLQSKLVAGKRGGYCYEQNGLFWRVLETVGFNVTPLAARVRSASGVVLPRTHMVLLVHMDGGHWLVDVGFGGDGLLHPLPIDSSAPAEQFLWAYRAVHEAGGWTLQTRRKDGWVGIYSFTAEPQLPADYEMANYYVSTNPNSRFTQTLTLQLLSKTQRLILRQRELTIDRGASVETRTLSRDEVFAMLRDVLALPAQAETQLDRFL